MSQNELKLTRDKEGRLDLPFNFGDMKDFNILEFGGGYGGLCHILSYMTKWNNYSFVEINEPIHVQH